jgi:hypothetical protein
MFPFYFHNKWSKGTGSSWRILLENALFLKRKQYLTELNYGVHIQGRTEVSSGPHAA